MSQGWKKNASFVETLKKLRELSVRVQRIELADKINRTKAMLGALTPPPVKGGPRG